MSAFFAGKILPRKMLRFAGGDTSGDNELMKNVKEAIALQLEGENPAAFGLRQTRRSWRATNWNRTTGSCLRPNVLSGAEVVRILASYGFDVASQRGSHIKLRRALPDGGGNPYRSESL